jgi:phosphoribosylformylglycinamidine synthase
VLAEIREAVRSGELSSCHDVAEGGFLVAIAEACLAGELGVTCEIPSDEGGLPDEILFGEDSCGFIVSGSREALERLGERIPLDVFGTVGGDRLALDPAAGLEWSLEELVEAHSALGLLFP